MLAIVIRLMNLNRIRNEYISQHIFCSSGFGCNCNSLIVLTHKYEKKSTINRLNSKHGKKKRRNLYHVIIYPNDRCSNSFSMLPPTFLFTVHECIKQIDLKLAHYGSFINTWPLFYTSIN